MEMERHQITIRDHDRTGESSIDLGVRNSDRGGRQSENPFDEAPRYGSQTSEDVLDTTSEEEETSSSGSSSGNDESLYEDEEGAEDDEASATSSTPMKPKLTSPPAALKSRLTSFLPQLQQANADLEKDPDAAMRRVDNVADSDEHYIEMNLGLGVLNARESAADDSSNVKTTMSDDRGSDSESSSPFEAEETTQVGIINKLKGVKPAKRKIEEVS